MSNGSSDRSGVDVVGIGLRCLDVALTTADMPTWEHGGWVSDFRFQGGGPVGTALVAASRLGAGTGFIGTIGNDDIGQIKRRSLTDYGIDVSRTVTLSSPERQVAFVYVHEETGERVFSRNAHMRDFPLTVDQLDRDYVTSARCLHLDGFYPEASAAAARWMREANREVVLDMEKPKGNELEPWVSGLVKLTDILICGEGGTRAITGIMDLPTAARAVLAMGPRIVVETLGERGSYTATTHEAFHTPAFRVNVVNTTGAGDVFHGAYIVGRLSGWDARFTAVFSSAVSAVTCMTFGGPGRIPTMKDVLKFLRDRGVEIPPGAADAGPTG
jgi:sulfofructose kinase